MKFTDLGRCYLNEAAYRLLSRLGKDLYTGDFYDDRCVDAMEKCFSGRGALRMRIAHEAVPTDHAMESVSGMSVGNLWQQQMPKYIQMSSEGGVYTRDIVHGLSNDPAVDPMSQVGAFVTDCVMSGFRLTDTRIRRLLGRDYLLLKLDANKRAGKDSEVVFDNNSYTVAVWPGGGK